MIWFSYMRSPLGPSVRLSYAAPVDVVEGAEGYEAGEGGSVMLEILCPSREEDLYRISTLDPDLVDVLKGCGEGCCALLARAL